MPIRKTFVRDALSYLFAMLLGVAAIAGPAVLLGLEGSKHPYYPSIINGMDEYSWPSFLFQIAGGGSLSDS